MDKQVAETNADGYVESVIDKFYKLLESGDFMLENLPTILKDAFMSGFEHGDYQGYQKGIQEEMDKETELNPQFGGKLFKERK